MFNKKNITVLGAGNMGTALAQVIANNGYQVKIWNHEGDPEPLKQIAESHENKKYLPGLSLSKNITPESDLATALKNAKVVVFVVPSNFMENMVKRAAPYISGDTICVDASKGMDEKSLDIVPAIIKKNLTGQTKNFVASISGPAIATDMAKGAFTAMNVASDSDYAIKTLKKIFDNDNLKLLPTKDMIGIEISGSFKNVYAIAIGICDGLKFPMNTKAALLVIALKEISALIKKMGGQPETVYDLSGLGDLVGTGLCQISRNRRFGEYLAGNIGKDEAAKKVGQVVEGANAAKMLIIFSKKYKVKMPFAEMIYRIVWKNKPIEKEMKKFLKTIK